MIFTLAFGIIYYCQLIKVMRMHFLILSFSQPIIINYHKNLKHWSLRSKIKLYNRLIYRFGFHSRITNEQLYDMVSDYKACVDIANFDFINGWTTMDSEVYVDYDVELKFFLKPF